MPSTYAHSICLYPTPDEFDDHYKTAEKTEALLVLGFLSALGERLAPEPGEITITTTLPDVCIAYHGIAAKNSALDRLAECRRMLAKAADGFGRNMCIFFETANGMWMRLISPRAAAGRGCVTGA